MEDVIIVEEKYSKYWLWAVCAGITFSVLLLILSNSISDIILANYLQLGAFGSFSVSIFAIIKIWEGKKSIRVSFENESLVVDIFKKEEALQRDRYQLEEIKDIYLMSSQISVPFLNIFIDRNSASTFQIQLKKEDKPFYLFQFSGKIISVNNEAAERVHDFFRVNNMNVTVSN